MFADKFLRLKHNSQTYQRNKVFYDRVIEPQWKKVKANYEARTDNVMRLIAQPCLEVKFQQKWKPVKSVKSREDGTFEIIQATDVYRFFRHGQWRESDRETFFRDATWCEKHLRVPPKKNITIFGYQPKNTSNNNRRRRRKRNKPKDMNAKKSLKGESSLPNPRTRRPATSG